MLRHGRTTPAAFALLCATLVPTTVCAQDRVVDRIALRLELGAGTMLSLFQRNDDPNDYDGNTKGFRSAALQATARFGVRLFGPVAVQVSLASWTFLSTTGGGAGWVVAPTGGLRVEPRLGSVGRLFIDGSVGAGFTGAVRRLTLDVGVGFEFELTRALSLGPVVRYGHVVQPDAYSDGAPNPFPQDARYFSAGISLAVRIPQGHPAHATPTPVTEPTRPPGDQDSDGVLDPDDVCPGVPAGDHADPARPGCPDADSDSDGVFDARDLCRSTAQGPHPDPARAGCPDQDGDGDGVPDHGDRCPSVAQGPRPDPARPGCPDPDTDQDGVVDSRDRCPDRPETFNNFEDADGCPDRPSLVTLSDGVIRILGTINFATGSDRIVGRRSFDILDSLVALIAAHTEIARFEVQGHTDDRGNRSLNQELSQRRASSVRLYLVEHGVDGARLEARGYGMERPIVPNTDSVSRAQNRRVEMHIVRYADGAAPPAPRPVTPPPTAAH